ncbi:MAG TPA: malonyl-CoA decarboxylase [Aliidongia sp.]|nr:malonyl-CoA decarboxylase [Aliidongia sp.]
MALSPEMTRSPRSWLDRLWTSIADRGRAFVQVPAATVPPLDRAKQLAMALLSERGEASGAAVARDLLSTLRGLAPDDRAAFENFLAEGFAPETETLRAAADAYSADPTPERAMSLFNAAEPPRQELLRRMNMAPGGTQALVGMRQELLARVRKEPVLKPLDNDLQHLFSSWFNRGFLELRRIDWDTPAAILEKLITYEAVHEIDGWPDLRRRLAPDRRCFAFFHQALPNEPLIFVEVALVRGIAASVQPLLALEPTEPSVEPDAADTAIFYSISNCQEGLRGVSFGNFLIKQVVEELKVELPGLNQFSTLSPVPGFRNWLEKRLAAKSEEGSPLAPIDEETAKLLAEIGKDDNWLQDEARVEALRGPLMRLCAEYLTLLHNGANRTDPVARFHLGNGATLERINWLGNTARRGLRESYGIMVNYLYDRETIEANHEAFVRHGAVARSRAVDALLTLPSPAAETPRSWTPLNLLPLSRRRV